MKKQSKAGALAITLTVSFVVVVVICNVLGWGDPRARKGYYKGKTAEEIQRDLDQQVDWYSMEISVASVMELAEGETEVEARIENVENNHCDQKVRMYLTDNPDDVLFESGAIAPGEYLFRANLAHPLPVGTHNVTVEFQGYERTPTLLSNEGVPLGHNRFGASASAEVTINVRPSDVTASE
jgi:hypothetical protein